MTETTTFESAEQRIYQLFLEKGALLNEEAPDFLRNNRQLAITNFLRLGIPSRRVENYKYTDLTKLFAQENYNRAFRPTSFDFDMQEVFTCDVPEFDTHILFHVNGWYFEQNNTDLFPKGTIIKSLKRALKEHTDLVEKYYGKLADAANDPIASSTEPSPRMVSLFTSLITWSLKSPSRSSTCCEAKRTSTLPSEIWWL